MTKRMTDGWLGTV